MVARYCDVDNAAGGDVVRKEDGREFDLVKGDRFQSARVLSHTRNAWI